MKVRYGGGEVIHSRLYCLAADNGVFFFLLLLLFFFSSLSRLLRNIIILYVSVGAVIHYDGRVNENGTTEEERRHAIIITGLGFTFSPQRNSTQLFLLLLLLLINLT